MKINAKKFMTGIIVCGLVLAGTDSVFAAKSSNKQVTVNKEQTEQQKIDQLIKYAYSLKGIKFKNGGATKKGFDSSGFVQYVFSKYGVKLPRTSREMAKVGSEVKRKDLKKGDLVFFDTNANHRKDISSGGMYIGKNKFIAATVTCGVSIHSLNNKYWSPKFRKATRVMKEETIKNVVYLDEATIKGFKQGKIKGLPFTMDKRLTMSIVEKAWGKPEKVLDFEDIRDYVYHKSGRQVVFVEDEMRNVYLMKVEMEITREEIINKMGNPATGSKKILSYKIGNYRINFEQSEPNKWWIIFFIN